jgi:hypothetical protein
MKIARMNNLKKIDHANDDFIVFHDIHVKSMLCTRSFNIFVSRQTRNYLRQFRLIRVAWAIEQRQRNDNTIYENIKSRFTYRFRRFLSHFFENIKKENARLIHSFAFVLCANYNLKLIEDTDTGTPLRIVAHSPPDSRTPPAG